MTYPSRVRVIAGALLLVATASGAQPRAMLRGTMDVEAWDTDTSSNLLSRNGGRPALLGRVTLWGAVEPLRSVVLYGLAESEAGAAVDSTHHAVQQAGIRYTPSRRLMIDAGKITESEAAMHRSSIVTEFCGGSW